MDLREPAVHPRNATSWRRSGDDSYWDGLKSEVNVVTRAPRVTRTPRPRSAIEGGLVDSWLRQAERTQSNHLQRSAHEHIPPFHDRTVSMSALKSEPVSLESRELSSCGAPSLCDSSLGSQESLQSDLSQASYRRGSWERVCIRQAPTKEQAKLSSLSPVKIGWLPIQGKVMAGSSQSLHVDNSVSQVKLRQPITPTLMKTPGKVNGFKQLDGGVERSPGGSNEGSARTWKVPDQVPPSHQQVSGRESSTSGESDRIVGWYLRKGWTSNKASPLSGGETQAHNQQAGSPSEPNRRSPPLRTTSVSLLRNTPSPNKALSVPQSTHTQTSTVTTLVPRSKTNFSSITIASRKVNRTASLPGSDPQSSHSEQFNVPISNPHFTQSKATLVKVTESSMTTSMSHPRPHSSSSMSCGPPMDQDCDTVVRKRKATIIKVTEHRETYSPAQSRSSHPEYRHSYTHGMYTENSLWQQPPQAPPQPSATPAHQRQEPPVERSGPTATTPSALVHRDHHQRSGGDVHRSTLCLFVPSRPASPAGRSVEQAGDEGRARPRRPLSCYANVFGHTEASRETAAPPAPAAASARKWSASLPRGTRVDLAKDGAGTLLRQTGCPAAESPVWNREGREREVTAEAAPRRQSLTLTKAQDSSSNQSPEEILALNAAAIIANIKLQRQLSKKRTPNDIPAEDSTASPTGKTPGKEVEKRENQRKDESKTAKVPDGSKIPARVRSPFVDYVPLGSDFENSTAKTISLRDALAQSKPGFISRSQGRLRALEQRAHERRELQEFPAPQQDATFRPPRGQCTRPSRLRDNLFQPRDRAITGKEMQLRSKRSYNNRPEVKRKKEEERRRGEWLANRQRVDIFKKKLLDQILQRGND